MTGIIPDHAFVLAAGLGTRLRPHTDTLPKPLVPVNGIPLLGYIFDHLKNAGITSVTVNLHHLPDTLRAFLATRTDMEITQSFEETLLDTGGGAKRALATLGNKPFYIINGDAFWQSAALSQLSAAFDPQKMDILLLLQPVSNMTLTEGVGDYDLTPDGRALRNKQKTGTHMFAGIRLCRPEIFSAAPDGAFSFLTLMDQAEDKGRLYGLHHLGEWHHISTPTDLAAVDRVMQER